MEVIEQLKEVNFCPMLHFYVQILLIFSYFLFRPHASNIPSFLFRPHLLYFIYNEFRTRGTHKQ